MKESFVNQVFMLKKDMKMEGNEKKKRKRNEKAAEKKIGVLSIHHLPLFLIEQLRKKEGFCKSLFIFPFSPPFP